jgi:hypothetical protein
MSSSELGLSVAFLLGLLLASVGLPSAAGVVTSPVPGDGVLDASSGSASLPAAASAAASGAASERALGAAP